MRIVRYLALGLLLAAFAQPAGSAANPGAGDALGFLRWVYSHYPSPSHGRPFDPTGRAASKVFDPGFVALFREDVRLAKGEVGAIDSDPLCDCQDDSGMRSRIEPVRMQGASRATARVDLRFGGDTDRLDISLIVVGGQWRIYDIASRSTPSLRQYLIKANRDHAAGRW